MEGRPPKKSWKHVKHIKTGSDKMDESFESNKSHSFSRFERSAIKKKEEQNRQMFAFGSKLKVKDKDYSVTGQGRRSFRGDENEDSKSEILKDLTKPIQSRFKPKKASTIDKSIMKIVKQLSQVNKDLRKTVSFYARKFRQLKEDWDLSFKHVLNAGLTVHQESVKKTVAFMEEQTSKVEKMLESNTVSQMESKTVSKLGTPEVVSKVIEADKGPQDDSIFNPGFSAMRLHQASRDEVLGDLPISQVRVGDNYAEHNMTRNQTLKELLSTEVSDKGTRELRNLRQTITRMWQILE